MTYPLRGLRYRLAAVYLVWFGALLAAGAGLLYLALERSYRDDIDRTLQQTLAAARDLYTRDRPEFADVRTSVAHIVNELIYADRAMVAFGPDGRVLGRSRRFPGAPVLDDWGDRRVPRPVTVVTSAGLARIQSGDLDWGIYVLVGISLAPIERQRLALRYVLLGGLPLLLLASAGVGVLAARPALLPIGVVADAAKRTSALVEGGARDFPLIPTRMVRDEVGALTTAFNRLLTRLSEALRRERAATERQRTFLADAAHELRTPVAIVLSAAEATLADQPDAEQGAESLRLIAGEARRMGGMVSDLLLLARSETGVTTEVRNRFFLEDAASSVVIRATRMPSAKNRSIRLGEFGTAPLNANRDLVERAIMALVDNALIHAPESPIEVSVGVASGRAWIRVRDWGPGVPPEDVDRIFERFSRGDTAASGSGLGLAIARWIAERHGGRLTYEAPSEGGASFLVTLPLAE